MQWSSTTFAIVMSREDWEHPNAGRSVILSPFPTPDVHSPRSLGYSLMAEGSAARCEGMES